MPLRSRRAASTPPSSSRRATIRRPREPHSPSERERRSPKPAAERSCRKKSCEPRPKIASAPSEPTTSEGIRRIAPRRRGRDRGPSSARSARGRRLRRRRNGRRSTSPRPRSACPPGRRGGMRPTCPVGRARGGGRRHPHGLEDGDGARGPLEDDARAPVLVHGEHALPASRASSSTAEDAATPGGRAWSSAGIAGTSGPSSIAPETSPARSSGTRRMRSPPSSQATRWSVAPSGRSVSRGERR